jgi:thiol-disulfide isomerase/thioredoxin
VTKKPTKAQVRAQAIAEKKRASEAAARARRNRFILWGGLAVVVVVAVVVAVVASGGSNDDASATKFETAPVKVTGTALPQFDDTKSPDPAVGETIPELQGKSVFDGKPVTIGPDSGDGEPQAIVFVAHWCPHCQAEVPRLVALAGQGVFDGVKVSAVATATSENADNYPPSSWLQRVDWPFPVMADSPSGTAAKAYGLSAFPYFVLVDKDGKVAGRATGEVSDADVKANIAALKAGEALPLTSSGASSPSS